jgi:hypothetical protein
MNIEYYYDSITDTLRRYGHLTSGSNVGERFDKKTKDWSSDCCRRSGCRYDKIFTDEEAKEVINRQSQ